MKSERRRKISKFCLFFLLSSLCLNCTWLVKPLPVTLKGVTFNNNEEMNLKLEINNPNWFSIKVAGIDYNIHIEQETIGVGKMTDNLNIRGKESVITNFPLKLNLINILKTLPLFSKDTLVFRIDGSYTLSTALGKTRLKFKTEKRIDLKEEFESLINKILGKAG